MSNVSHSSTIGNPNVSYPTVEVQSSLQNETHVNDGHDSSFKASNVQAKEQTVTTHSDKRKTKRKHKKKHSKHYSSHNSDSDLSESRRKRSRRYSKYRSRSRSSSRSDRDHDYSRKTSSQKKSNDQDQWLSQFKKRFPQYSLVQNQYNTKDDTQSYSQNSVSIHASDEEFENQDRSDKEFSSNFQPALSIPSELSVQDLDQAEDLLFRDKIKLVCNILSDILPEVELPQSHQRPAYAMSAPPRDTTANFQKFPPSKNFEQAFQDFRVRIDQGKTSRMWSFPESSGIHSKTYEPLSPLWQDCLSVDKLNSFNALLQDRNNNVSAYLTLKTLDKLEKMSRQPLHILSYMNWFLAASRRLSSQLGAMISKLQPDISEQNLDNFASIQDCVEGISQLHDTLGTALSDSVQSSVHIAGVLTLIKRDAYLSQLNKAVPQHTINWMRTSSLLGPHLFEQMFVDTAYSEMQKADSNKTVKAQVQVAQDMRKAISQISKRPVTQSQNQSNFKRKKFDYSDKQFPTTTSGRFQSDQSFRGESIFRGIRGYSQRGRAFGRGFPQSATRGRPFNRGFNRK